MLKNIIPVLFLFSVFVSCKNNSGKDLSANKNTEETELTGNFVTSEYQNRGESYDWVAVKVNELTDSILQIRH